MSSDVLRVLDDVTGALPTGGEQREGQRTMAAAVADAIASREHVVVQAGTGTGKSLAYLVPAALSGKRVVVATATKALQDQLAGKDLPFVESHLDRPVKVAVLKGRSNYLCRQRLDEADTNESRLEIEIADEPLDPATIATLREFSETNATGDRAELEASVDDRAWAKVSVGSDECPGAARCPRGDDCFAERARAKAAEADIVVLNLHLYALQVLTDSLPGEHEIVIIDEAHQLEDIVGEAASRTLSPGRLHALARNAGAVLAEPEFAAGLNSSADRLSDELQGLIGKRLLKLPDDLAEAVDAARNDADKVMNALRQIPKTAPDETRTKAMRATQAATSLIEDIDLMRFPTDADVAWVDGPPRHPSLRSTPIAVDTILSDHVWADRTAILTSATLPPGTVARFGLPPSTTTLDVGSPFDYESNALLYCAATMPDPRAENYRDARQVELESLIVAAGGRTLALFTSISAMRDAAEHLEPRLPWKILVQGDKAKAALLNEFTEDVESCLFATISFWQGVDVPGRSCSLVTIDKLPFPRPDNPVLQARRDLAGARAFGTVDLPRAATLLAQGAGRLIRRTDDKGVVAVLDPRLATSKSYRWELIKALPPMTRTRDREEAEAFLRSLRDE